MVKAKVQQESKKSMTKKEETPKEVENKTKTRTKTIRTLQNVAVNVTKKDTTKKETVRTHSLVVDKTGLSINPGRIRRLLLDVILNSKNRVVDKELKEHKKMLLEASNLKEGYLSYHGFTQGTLEYLRDLVNSHLTSERVKYERRVIKDLLSKETPVSETLQTLLESRKRLLKEEPSVNLVTLYEKYDKKFYKNYNEQSRIYGLTGEDAYKFYRSLVSRDRISINYSGNLRLTCFLELVLKHLVSHASTSCVINNKLTLNFNTMDNSLVENNYLVKIVQNLHSWNTALSWHKNGRSEGSKEVPNFVNVDVLNPGNKFRSNSYVVDVFKNVSRGLSMSPPSLSYPETVQQQKLSSLFESVKLSTEFKQLCGQILLEVVHCIGNILKIILSAGKDRTITSSVINSMIKTYHVTLNETNNLETTNLELDRMVSTFNTTKNKTS
jgi:hypothetical protein